MKKYFTPEEIAELRLSKGLVLYGKVLANECMKFANRIYIADQNKLFNKLIVEHNLKRAVRNSNRTVTYEPLRYNWLYKHRGEDYLIDEANPNKLKDYYRAENSFTAPMTIILSDTEYQCGITTRTYSSCRRKSGDGGFDFCFSRKDKMIPDAIFDVKMGKNSNNNHVEWFNDPNIWLFKVIRDPENKNRNIGNDSLLEAKEKHVANISWWNFYENFAGILFKDMSPEDIESYLWKLHRKFEVFQQGL